MSTTTTMRAAALAIGTALAIGPLAAPAATASPRQGTVTASATRSTATVRDAKWERAVYVEINRLRTKRHLRPVSADTCLAKAMQPVALRASKAQQATTWTKDDSHRIALCVHRGLLGHVQYAWGPGGRTAADTVSRVSRLAPAMFGSRMTHAGVAVYRDGRGRHWMAIAQLYVTKP